MSRCFPFPPPGYEKKTRNDDTDLITKEKRKEKKRKKDKDKERREGKERKDEERSKEKNREKKDRKEKKKDKKERDRDREKSRTSDEKKVEGKQASHNGEKSGPNNLQSVEIGDSKIVQELGSRFRDEDRNTGNTMVQKGTVADKGRAELQGKALENNFGNWAEEKRKTTGKGSTEKANGQGNQLEARGPEIATVHNCAWMDQRRTEQSNIGYLAEEKRKTKDKNDARKANEQGKKVEASGPENATLHNSAWMDQRRIEQSNLGYWSEEKWTIKDKNNGRKTNEQGNKVEARGPENAAVHNSAWMDQRRIEEMQVEKKDVQKQMERKENNQHNGNHRRDSKHKDKKREKKSKSKDKHRDKDREKVEKMKRKGEPETEQTKLKGTGQESLDAQNFLGTPLNEKSKSFANSGNLGKRKELKANVLLDENHIQPNKLRRLIPSHTVEENGRKLELSQTVTQLAPEKKVMTYKECKINGFPETQQQNFISTRTTSSAIQPIENGEASAELPHPDTKYLKQILSVPKMEEWSDFDDQKWLFGTKNLHSEKTKPTSLGFDGTAEVWAEALQIKSADIAALPYVIPY